MLSRTTVVTGAGSGIGRATVLLLARQGHHVYAVGRRIDRLQETQALAAKGAVDVIAADVSDHESLKKALERIPTITGIVANAGICRQALLDEPGALRIWHETVAVNLTGVYLTILFLSPKLEEHGHVVTLSSGLGKLGRAGYSAYSASKHGVLGLTKSLSKELAPRSITVNAVCPGWVDTTMAHRDLERTAAVHGTRTEDERRRATDTIALGRFVQPEEVADLISFLLSPQSSAITGQAYNISGGEFFA
ncbi:MAG: SDR family oxidoreductase [Deltaproteobacteria bacterium]|nr:SDR family oxidoreductase [Deltaproteobacteria bacterium]